MAPDGTQRSHYSTDLPQLQRVARSRGSSHGSLPIADAEATLSEQFSHITETATEIEDRRNKERRARVPLDTWPHGLSVQQEIHLPVATNKMKAITSHTAKSSPRLHMPNVAQLWAICNEQADNSLVVFKKELAAREKEIAILRAKMEAMMQSLRQNMGVKRISESHPQNIALAEDDIYEATHEEML